LKQTPERVFNSILSVRGPNEGVALAFSGRKPFTVYNMPDMHEASFELHLACCTIQFDET
jgi:hypothetical protein